ncbi:MAG: O-antigen ligase family protein [Opitutaceae bacterium]|nr:O-antigen ligase family protein [Opitutaceae bacterium]
MSQSPERAAPTPPLRRSLEQFRAPARRRPLPALEIAAVAIVGVHLVFLPWAIGGMPVWAQIASAALAVAGFVVALIPRAPRDDTGSPAGIAMWPRLIAFPVFWIGLALLGYITAQALNPAWVFRSDAANFWMERIPHLEWLPAGVSAPFDRWNPWRSLLVYGSAWLTLCTVWVACTRRRSLQLLLIALVANGVLLAAFGVLQKLTGTAKLYWSLPSPSLWFFASFVYKNHAAAYLNLALTAAGALAAWYHVRGLRRHEKSNPAGLFAFFAMGIAVAVLASYARGATLVMMVLVVGCAAVLLWHRRAVPAGSRHPAVAFALLVVFAVFLVTGFRALRSHDAFTHLRQGLTQQDRALEVRGVATAAALEMLAEHRLTGVGAGAFRYLFPIHQAKHPALTMSLGERRHWEHAHNDVVQFPIELGLPGVALGLLALGYALLTLVRHHFWDHPLGACGVLGLLLLPVYAWWDFPFQSPAILITWCALWPVIALWVKVEELAASD